MPPDLSGERLAKLEAIVAGLLSSGPSRADFEIKALEKLAVISFQIAGFADYQKTCEATSDAHGVRLNKLENTIDGFDKARRTLLWFCGILGAIAVFMVSIAALVLKHGS